MADNSKVNSKTFVLHVDPDPDDLKSWKGGAEYKEGDQVNYEETSMQCLVENKDDEFDQKKWGPANNDYSCTIRKPGFKELNAALSSMTNLTGDLDFGSGGKFIFDTCKIKADPMFKEENGLLMLSIAILIGNHYLRPYKGEVKKN